MKASRILFGIGVGVAAGFVVALQGRDDKSVKNNTIDRTAPTGSKSELQREFETIKQSFNDILNYGVQIKNESAEFGSSIGGEISHYLETSNLTSILILNVYSHTSKIYKIVARILETKFLSSRLRSRSQLFLLVTAYLFFKFKCQINEMTLEIRYFLSSLF